MGSMASPSRTPGLQNMPGHQSAGTQQGTGPQPAALDQSGIHILLVDDERLSRVVVANQLRKCNYKGPQEVQIVAGSAWGPMACSLVALPAVTVAESGGQALELLQQQAPGTFQLLLTDVMMPQVDGIDLLRFVRSNHNFMDLPVVMMSASEQAETMCECIRGGAEEYLVKPVTQKEIQKIWTHVLRRNANGVNIAPQPTPNERLPKPQDAANQHDTVQAGPATQELGQGKTSGVPRTESPTLMPTPLHLLQQPPAKQAHGGPAPEGAVTGTRPTRQAAGARPTDSSVQQMCMRQWLSRPGRQSQSAESLWVFTQVLLLVERWYAAAAGTCLGSRLRPSQLVLHSNGRVEWAKHALPAPTPRTSMSNAANTPAPATHAQPSTTPPPFAPPPPAGQVAVKLEPLDGEAVQLPAAATTEQQAAATQQQQQQEDGGGPQPSNSNSSSASAALDELEASLYLSPEEVAGQPATPASDVFRLGLLMFELLMVPSKQARLLESWCNSLQHVRQGILPDSLQQAKPAEAALLKTMLHSDPNQRCTVAQLLQSGLIKSLAAAVKASAKSTSTTSKTAGVNSQSGLSDLLLVDFLRIMHSKKRTELQALETSLASLDQDIDMLEHALKARKVSHPPPSRTKSFATMPLSPRASGLVTKGSVGASGGPVSPRATGDMSPFATAVPSAVVREMSVARSGQLPGESALVSPAGSGPLVGQATARAHDQAWMAAQETWKRLETSHVALEELYYTRRKEAASAAGEAAATAMQLVPAAVPSDAVQPANSPAGAGSQRPGLPACMSTFCDDLLGFSRYRALRLRASLQQGDTLSSSNMVCSIAIDRDDELFASAGVSKRIRIYELSSIMHGATLIAGAYPVLELTSRSRLSSVCWSSYIKSHLAAADYEGVVALWDVHANVELVQFEEHAKRVWAVDLCRKDPSRLASASDDGTVRIWAINQESSVATVPCHANVCSVQWNPEAAHLFACGSANCRASVYDMRNLSRPVATISTHQKAVSYVRHMSGTQLLTASTDNTIRRWDLSGMQGDINGDMLPSEHTQLPCLAVYQGHVNERNFVGLSVSADGYIACGSEDNDLKCYYQAMPFPALSHSFSHPSGGLTLTGQQAAREQMAQSSGPQAFVSSVCWAQNSGLLLAANSLGAIHVMELT